jgi:hypothetical protein
MNVLDHIGHTAKRAKALPAGARAEDRVPARHRCRAAPRRFAA